MWLVLCAAQDLEALWAYRGLKRRGLEPLEVITTEALVYNSRLEHRIGSTTNWTSILLADGRTIDSAAVRGTLNRVQSLPAQHLARATEADRQYAQQELFALFLSWLGCLPGPMLNRPTPRGLCGAWRHPSEWAWLAGRAGFSVMPYRLGDAAAASTLSVPPGAEVRHVLVLDGHCWGADPPATVKAACARLSALTNTRLLGLDLAVTGEGQWFLIGAMPLPNLCLGGEPFLDALAASLQQPVGADRAP